MNADFLNAHNRHLRDANLLFANQNWANADHLYGMAAECGLKRIMQAFGMTMNPAGSPKLREDRQHVDFVWARFETYRSGHSHGANYVLPTPSSFDDWKAEQRYAREEDFNQARAKAHKDGAELINGLIKQAQLEGLF